MKSFFPLALVLTLLPQSGRAQAAANSSIPWERVGTVSWSRVPDTREIMDLDEELGNRLDRLTPAQRQSGRSDPDLIALSNRIARLRDALPSHIKVQFKGGKLSELLAIIGHPPLGNIQVIPDGKSADLETDLPPFTLENADLTTLFGVVQGLLERRGLALNPVGSGPGNENSYVGLLSRPPGLATASGGQELEALQLTDYRSPSNNVIAVDVLVDALRTAWALEPTRKPEDLLIKYHEPTKMLLIAGPPPTSRVVRQVAAGLPKLLLTPPPDFRSSPPAAKK